MHCMRKKRKQKRKKKKKTEKKKSIETPYNNINIA